VNPFLEEGEWLRCAFHTHSLESDGDLPPEALAAHYERVGFDVLSITDHWRLTKVASTRSLLTVPGAELTFDLPEPGRVGEVLAFGIQEIPADPGGNRDNWYADPVEHWEQRTFPDLSTAARFVGEQGGVTYLAHPYWSGLGTEVAMGAEHVAGLEVWNATGELETGRGDSSPWWDSLLEAGREAFGIATDDSHYPLFDIGHAWTWVRVPERSEESVVQALRTGATYFSAGPTVHEVHRDGPVVEVSCSPCRAVFLQMEAEKGCSVIAGDRGRRFGRILETDDDGLVTRARIESPWTDPQYVRVRAVDARGRSAWTNAL